MPEDVKDGNRLTFQSKDDFSVKAKHDIVQYFLKLCYSIEVQESNEICWTTLKLKTDSNVEVYV